MTETPKRQCTKRCGECDEWFVLTRGSRRYLCDVCRPIVYRRRARQRWRVEHGVPLGKPIGVRRMPKPRVFVYRPNNGQEA